MMVTSNCQEVSKSAKKYLGHLQLLGVLGNLGPVSLQLDLQLLQLPVQLPDNCNSEKDEKNYLGNEHQAKN